MIRLGDSDPLTVYPAFRAGLDAVVVSAPAKLNLFLEIIRKRPDGYHDLESLMVVVDLFDTLEVRGNATGTISLSCNNHSLPTDASNLIVKAADALRTHVSRPDLGATIHLTKRIPMQAGLAGGSADAALALLSLNEIWKLALTRDELMGMAAVVGSDVALFLNPPAGWCEGRGEIVTRETPGCRLDFVLACPAIGLSTARVFGALAVPGSRNSGDSLRAAVRAGDPEAVGRNLFNRLQEPALALVPGLAAIRERLERLGACGAQMTGSGTAVFALCRSRDEATKLATAFRETRPADELESRVLVVRSIAP